MCRTNYGSFHSLFWSETYVRVNVLNRMRKILSNERKFELSRELGKTYQQKNQYEERIMLILDTLFWKLSKKTVLYWTKQTPVEV